MTAKAQEIRDRAMMLDEDERAFIAYALLETTRIEKEQPEILDAFRAEIAKCFDENDSDNDVGFDAYQKINDIKAKFK